MPRNKHNIQDMRLFYSFLAYFIFSGCQAQNDNLYESKIKEFTTSIDSLNQLNTHYFITRISDGIIRRSDGKNGGYGIETLTKNDSIYKIRYSGGIDFYEEKDYYFKSNQLVYAVLKISKQDTGILFKKQQIYKNEILHKEEIKIDKLVDFERNIIQFSLLIDAKEMFKDESNSR